MSAELELYGIIPKTWYFDERQDRVELCLVTDVSTINLPLTKEQARTLKERFEHQRKRVGRQWRDGFLCIPTGVRNEGDGA